MSSSSRLQLKAILVVLVTILSLFVASARSPDAVFATLSARAAVQDTHEGTLRTTPSSSDGSDGIVAGLRAGIETPKTVTKTVHSVGDRDSSSGEHLRASQPSLFAQRDDLVVSSSPHVPDIHVDPPTRARARLMVFLN